MEIFDVLENYFDTWYDKGYLLIGAVVLLIVLVYVMFKRFF